MIWLLINELVHVHKARHLYFSLTLGSSMCFTKVKVVNDKVKVQKRKHDKN